MDKNIWKLKTDERCVILCDTSSTPRTAGISWWSFFPESAKKPAARFLPNNFQHPGAALGDEKGHVWLDGVKEVREKSPLPIWDEVNHINGSN